jgi:integrase
MNDIILNMRISNDPKLKKILDIKKKNISKSRKKIYTIVLEDIYKITGFTPTQLIKKLKEDQTPFIERNTIVFKDMDDRIVTEIFEQYYLYLLENKKTSIRTIDSYLNTLRTFLGLYNIELPDKIELDVPKIIIKKGDIPDLKDIRFALENTKHVRDKAIILFLATTGIRSGDMRNFTIKDLLEATEEYHEGTIKSLLSSKYSSIIPTWHFIPSKTAKKGNVCVTFNTPECSELILTYLRNHRENLTEKDYLFASIRNKKLPSRTLLDMFKRLNDNVFGRTDKNKRFFRGHSLRKFFISTCNHNSGDLAKVNLLSGHSNKSSVHDAYNEVNTEVMKRFYTKLIPFLSIRDTRVHDVEPAELVKLKNKVKTLEEEKANMAEDIYKKVMEDINNPK